MSDVLEISDAITFESAIALTQTLLDRVEQALIETTDFGAMVTKLLATHNGARGFLVAYLTDGRDLVEALMPTVLVALEMAPVIAPALLVKNLAMSTAMEITHRRQTHLDQAAQSAQVQRRTVTLMTHLGLTYLQPEAEGLWQGLTANTGSYATFLERWGYDAEQRTAITQQLTLVYPELTAAVN